MALGFGLALTSYRKAAAAAAPSGSFVKVFTASGTFTIPSGVSSIKLEALGAGTAGGLGLTGCYGGAGGAWAVVYSYAVTSGMTAYINVPAAGPYLTPSSDAWVNFVANSPPTSIAEGVLAKSAQYYLPIYSTSIGDTYNAGGNGGVLGRASGIQNRGGGGGAGASPLAGGGAGGNGYRTLATSGGGGGGGSLGASSFGTAGSSSLGGNGGLCSGASGGSGATTTQAAAAGINGGGGGGGSTTVAYQNGAAGSAGPAGFGWTDTVSGITYTPGSGGGGGGNNGAASGAGANGGGYGSGGGGGLTVSGAGGDGLVILTYTVT